MAGGAPSKTKKRSATWKFNFRDKATPNKSTSVYAMALMSLDKNAKRNKKNFPDKALSGKNAFGHMFEVWTDLRVLDL